MATRVKRTRHVEYRVYAGSGHGGPIVFTDLEAAVARAEREASTPSYLRKGAFQATQLMKITTICEHIPVRTPCADAS